MSPNYSQKKVVFWFSVFYYSVALMAFFLGFVLAKRQLWVSIASIILVVVFYFVVKYAVDQFYNYFQGLKGEFKVNAILSQMWSGGYRYVYDIALTKNGNIDHVVVGPTGVWVIETKHVDGEIELVDGKLTKNKWPFSKDPLSQTYAEAQAVQSMLMQNGFNVTVEPVLVFSGEFAKVRFGNKKVKGVSVIGFTWLQGLIANKNIKQVLTTKQIDQIYSVLKGEKQRQIDA